LVGPDDAEESDPEDPDDASDDDDEEPDDEEPDDEEPEESEPSPAGLPSFEPSDEPDLLAARVPRLDPPRSFFAQPEPLKWIVGRANCLRIVPSDPQDGQKLGPGSLIPCRMSAR